LEVNLNEPRTLFESRATRLELYTVITDDTLEAMAANFTPRIEDLERGVEALSNKLIGLEEDFNILSKEPGPPGVSPEDPGYLPPTPLTAALERG